MSPNLRFHKDPNRDNHETKASANWQLSDNHEAGKTENLNHIDLRLQSQDLEIIEATIGFEMAPGPKASRAPRHLCNWDLQETRTLLKVPT